VLPIGDLLNGQMAGDRVWPRSDTGVVRGATAQHIKMAVEDVALATPWGTRLSPRRKWAARPEGQLSLRGIWRRFSCSMANGLMYVGMTVQAVSGSFLTEALELHDDVADLKRESGWISVSRAIASSAREQIAAWVHFEGEPTAFVESRSRQHARAFCGWLPVRFFGSRHWLRAIRGMFRREPTVFCGHREIRRGSPYCAGRARSTFPVAAECRPLCRAPRLGEHTHSVLSQIGRLRMRDSNVSTPPGL